MQHQCGVCIRVRVRVQEKKESSRGCCKDLAATLRTWVLRFAVLLGCPSSPLCFAFDFVLFFSVLLCFWLCCRAGFSCYATAWQKCKFCCMFAIRKVFFLLFWFFCFLLIAAPFCRFFLIYIWFLVVFKLLMCCPPVVVVVAVAFGELALVCCYCNLLKFHNASERHCLYVFMFINSTRRVAYAAMAYSH